jgi:hypothetical protein
MRSEDHRDTGTSGTLSTDERRQLAESVAALREAYGPRWTRVPYGLGDQALRARKILTTGPLAIRPDDADPVRTVQEMGAFAKDTADMAGRLMGHASYLGEVFGTDITGLPLARLRRLSRAVLRLADGPVPEPSWAFPSMAHAASMTLSALGDDLREVGALRREIYEEFSEDVWTLACAKNPPAVDRWWQSARRSRVRRRLATVTRDGRPTADVKRAVAVLRRTNELEANIAQVWTAASNHLGEYAEAGIPDVDGAEEALAALHDLHLALGEHLDPEKLRSLVAADAFVCQELTGPATEISVTIATWRSRTKQLNVVDAISYSAPQLQRWAADVAESLQLLSTLRDTTGPLRASTRTVAEIFDDVIVRDNVHRLCAVNEADDLNEGVNL